MLCEQGYDGVGSMAGKRRGVAARIMDKYPKALYTHCALHVHALWKLQASLM